MSICVMVFISEIVTVYDANNYRRMFWIIESSLNECQCHHNCKELSVFQIKQWSEIVIF